MDYYESWESFVSNIDVVPDKLDGEKLIHMVSALSCTRSERESLGRAAAEGDKTSLECFLNAYVPMIVGTMKKYSPRIGYNRDILMGCVEKVREKVANTLYLDNLEYNTTHYVDWMVRNEVTKFIVSQDKRPEEHLEDKKEDEPKVETIDELIEKISVSISDQDQAERIKKMLQACRNDRERQLLAFRFGLEDGVPKTLQETADKFGISRERARQIESMAIRRSVGHIRRRKSIADFLNE